MSPQAAELVGSTKWAGLVAELQACAEELQHEDWQDEGEHCPELGPRELLLRQRLLLRKRISTHTA